MRTCFKCGSENLQGTGQTSREGILRVALRCSDCGAHNGHMLYPMTLERALKLTMPFGKWKGSSLAQIASVDAAYLIWARDNIETKDVVDAINLVIQSRIGRKE